MLDGLMCAYITELSSSTCCSSADMPPTNVSAWKLDFERIIAPSIEFGRSKLITPTHGTLQNRKTVETRSNYAIFFNITLQFKGSSHCGDKIACVQEATL
jgi:hypothetical protein